MPISYKHKIYTTLGTPTTLSGGIVSSTDNAGVPTKDYTVKGRTIVWNQLRTNQTSSGSGSTSVQYAKIGSAETSLVYGHKYYVRFYVKYGAGNTNNSSVGFKLGNFGYAEFSMAFFPTDSFVLQEQISTLNSSAGAGENRSGFIKYSDSSKVLSIEWKNLQIFDLTQMFGAGNEPSTPSEFRAMFPDDYYPYNAGELKTIVPTSVAASTAERFQLLDKSKYPATRTINGVTFTNNGDGTFTVNGNATNSAYIQLNTITMKLRHKYLINDGDAGVSFGSYCTYLNVNGNNVANTSSSNEINIYTANQNILCVCYIRVSSGIEVPTVVFKPQLFDLTQMFGAGNEPATVAEFWQRVPETLYGYNPSAYKSVNIPSSKYFPDGMRSAVSAYDEINFLSQKAIKRVGVRPYQAGDENNTSFITDKKNTVYALSTPVETTITPPLQALSTYKGFTSFSAPNSLTQNGPLSVTYYAEGGTNPESGWLTSYKRKLYMGRTIEWNQLLDKSKFEATKTIAGVNIKNNGDGTYTLNGTYTSPGTNWFTFYNDNDLSIAKRLYGHKVLYGFKSSANYELENKSCGMSYEINGNVSNGVAVGRGESCAIQTLNKVSPSDITRSVFYIVLGVPSSGTAVYKNLIIRPQLFDLTQMFGAGNEPATPEEFWSYFDHKLYPYNAGETQPLFKISRKSYIYKEPAGYTVYFADWVWIADTVTIFVEYTDGSTETLTSQNDMGGKSRSNVVKMTFTDTDSERYVRYKMPANGGSEETLYMTPTATLVLTADAEIEGIDK